VRTALGASRRRVVAQLFVEALVLSGLAAGTGLALARYGIMLGHGILETETGPGAIPYFVDLRLTPATVVYVIALALLAALIAGAVPAFQATGRRVQSTLRALGGATGMHLGRTWTFLIVAQVALAVAACRWPRP
jgi:ABC-type lipoprotein release transport system permease subunit